MPNMLPADLENLLQDFLVTENTVYDPSMEGRVCAPNVLGDKTFCLPSCHLYNFLDYETKDDIPPCFAGLKGTNAEKVISNITTYIEEPVENENLLCFFDELDSTKTKCLSRFIKSV